MSVIGYPEFPSTVVFILAWLKEKLMAKTNECDGIDNAVFRERAKNLFNDAAELLD